MKIGIDGSRAFLKQRTGIEEYSYQVIKHLTNCLKDEQVIVYVRQDQMIDFDLPANWKIKSINFSYFWTQIGLAFELWKNPIDVLFVPAHTVPLFHPKKTVVTIHGLEYEFVPAAYSWWERFYMRLVIKNSCRWAKTIISVSNNTKADLEKLYGIVAEKIKVIYEGYENCHSGLEPESSHKTGILDSRFYGNDKFLLFIGRLEERKNVIGIIKAFEILKERYKIPHKLILAGRFGYGGEKIQAELEKTNCASEIVLTGFVSEEKKWELLHGADVFMFPTFYEGFGIPILEAQSVGVPVVASNNSAIPEITTNYELNTNVRITNDKNESKSAILVDPMNAEQIADSTYGLISDEKLRIDMIKKGYENVARFGWEKCASQIAEILIVKN